MRGGGAGPPEGAEWGGCVDKGCRLTKQTSSAPRQDQGRAARVISGLLAAARPIERLADRGRLVAPAGGKDAAGAVEPALEAIAAPSSVLVVLVAALLLMPSALVARYRWIPKAEGVPWVVYAATLLAVLLVPSLRSKARAAWPTLPAIVRDFVRFGLSIPGIWCLDPANARVWYRQIHLDSVPPAVPHEQVTRLVHFLTYDYVASAAWVLPVVIAGLVGVLLRWRRATALPLALH